MLNQKIMTRFCYFWQHLKVFRRLWVHTRFTYYIRRIFMATSDFN